MATNNPNAAQGANQKTPWLLITLIVLIFLLATGAAIGGTWLFMSSGTSTDAADAVEQHEAKPLPEPVYVALDPFTVNLNGRRGRVLYVVLSLKVADDAIAERVTGHMPQVRNRILMVLTTQEADALMTQKGKRALAQNVRVAVSRPFNKDAGPLTIGSVLFTDFIVQ